MSIRIKRLQQLIHHKAAMVILRDLHDPRLGLVTVSRVELAKDLSQCKIYWSTLEEGGQRTKTAKGLEDARGFVQREIASVLKTRVTPQITFVFDPTIEGVERVHRLLRSALDDDRHAALQRGDDPDAPLSDTDD